MPWDTQFNDSSGHGRMARSVIAAILVLVVLAGCGDDDADDPTATADAGQPGVETPASTDASPPVETGQAATPDRAARTRAPRTVGQLADRIAAAWPQIEMYRAVTTQGIDGEPPLPPPLTPAPGVPPTQPGDVNPSALAQIDDVILPDQRHLIESRGGDVTEYLAVDGRVYVRGRFAQIAIRPDLDAATWVELEPDRVSPGSPLGQIAVSFAGPDSAQFQPPLANLDPETRALDLTAEAPRDVDGRTCQTYRWTETTQTGEALVRIIAIEESGLPCLIEIPAGEYLTQTTYTYAPTDPPITIDAPTDAIPVGDPPPGVATPAAPAPAGTPIAAEAATPIATPAAPAATPIARSGTPAATPLAVLVGTPLPATPASAATPDDATPGA